MPLTRRGLLASGLSAAVWTTSRNDAAAEAAPRSLEAAAAELKLGSAGPTRALGYDGASPGPVLQVKAGEKLELAFRNALAEPTSLAFPGLRGPRSALAFGALGEAPIAPNASRTLSLATSEPGFQIYGALLGADPTLQMARGLYGPLVIDEPSPPEIDLEAIVLIADWRLGADGQLADLGDAMIGRGPGRVGATVTVNGAPAPLALSGPPGGRVRLRLANAATARVLILGIEGVKPLVVAVDGQPSATFAPLRNLLPVGPGARFELMFDLPREGAARFLLKADDPSAADEPLVLFSVSGLPATPRGPIQPLPDNPRLPPEIALERALRADIVIAGGDKAPLTLNGAAAPAKPLFSVARNAPVALAFTNRTAYVQTLRITGHVARLLHSLDDGWDPYWRDIFIIPPAKTVHAAFVADNPGLWPLELTAPERRNAGLMGVFAVA